MRFGHLDGVLNRTLGLVLESRRTAIPELRQAVSAIDGGGGATAALLAADTRGKRSAIGKAVFGSVAGGARNGFIRGQALVEIKQPVELDLLRRIRVVGRPRNGQ